jgi:hypothetical protein
MAAVCARAEESGALGREGVGGGAFEVYVGGGMRLQRARLTADVCEPLTIIGRGAFGEVGGITWGCWGGRNAGKKGLWQARCQRDGHTHLQAGRHLMRCGCAMLCCVSELCIVCAI